MASFTYSLLANNSFTSFDPSTDVLTIDDAALLATDFRPSQSADGRGITLEQKDPNTGATTNTITLWYTESADTTNFYKTNTTMLVFASGSKLVVGDDSVNLDDESDHTLTGSATGDLLISFGGSDTVNGGDGNDYLVTLGGAGGTFGGSGADEFNGGNGTDTLGLDSVAGLTGYTVNLFEGTGSVAGTNSSSFAMTGIENVDGSNVADNITGNNGNNNLSGWDGNDTLSGGKGSDNLWGSSGNDSINGGAGFDRALYYDDASVRGDYTITSTGGQTYTVAGNGFTDTISGGVEQLSFNGEDVLLTSANVAGGHVVDYAALGNGSETAFDPTVNTLAITDSSLSAANFILSNVTGGNAGKGATLTQLNPATGAPVKSISLLFTPGSDDTNLLKITSSNIVFANGSMLLIGDDTTGTTDDTYTGALTGSSFNDLLISVDGAQSLSGGGGNDVLYGGAGNDTLDGGNGYDMATYEINAAGAVTVNLTAGTATDSFGGTDTLTNIESIRGTSFGDTLTGDSANLNTYLSSFQSRTFEGLGGDDTINGGTSLPGNVTIASYASSSGGVTVNLATGGNGPDGTGSASGGNIGQDSLINIGFVVGSAYDDQLTGGSHNASTIAAGHFEQFEGGLGNDTIDGGEGTDRASYQNASGSVTVVLDTDGNNGNGYSGTATGAAGNDVLLNIEQVRGSGYADNLTGGASNDAFEGLGGNDTIVGGMGTDTIRFDRSSAAVTVTFSETLGEGTAL
ncbi:MAG: calcium-binding protein, partial [Sulfuritalea sp.]|nr:calcium-binding protein [Sulfuritalea sp.]